MANAYFKLSKSTARQPYRFNLHAPNHEIILGSENYAGKAGASERDRVGEGELADRREVRAKTVVRRPVHVQPHCPERAGDRHLGAVPDGAKAATTASKR